MPWSLVLIDLLNRIYIYAKTDGINGGLQLPIYCIHIGCKMKILRAFKTLPSWQKGGGEGERKVVLSHLLSSHKDKDQTREFS